MWLKTYGLDPTHDSFFIDVDGDASPACVTDGNTTCVHIFDNAEQRQPCEVVEGQSCTYSRFESIWWNPLNDRSAGSCGACTGSFVERRLTLTAGQHTITFRQRDPDARLYYAILTTDVNFEPSDPQPTPTPAPIGPGPVRPHKHRCNNKIDSHSHPTTGAHVHKPCPW